MSVSLPVSGDNGDTVSRGRSEESRSPHRQSAAVSVTTKGPGSDPQAGPERVVPVLGAREPHQLDLSDLLPMAPAKRVGSQVGSLDCVFKISDVQFQGTEREPELTRETRCRGALRVRARACACVYFPDP